MAKKSYKKEKIEERLLHDMNTLLRSHLRDTRLKFVTITKVEITADYSYAKLYWDTYDVNSRGDAKKAISNISSKVRAMLSKSLKIRHTPEIQFIYDSQFEEEQNVVKILEEEKIKGKFN